MENSVSLILCVSGSCGFSEVVLENTLRLAGENVQLLVYSKSTSPQMRQLFETVSDVFVDFNQFEDAPQAINYLLTKITGTYVVLMPYEAILPSKWLSEFLFVFNSFEHFGALTIPYKVDTIELKPVQVLNQNYEIQTLYCAEEYDHYGITCFKTHTLLMTGAFDETLPLKLSLRQYLFRIAMTGLKNYCVLNIPSTSLIQTINSQNEFVLYQNTLKELVRKKNPFLQLHNLTPLEEIAYHDLDNLVFKLNNGAQKFCSKFIRHFGIVCPSLNSKQINQVKKYALKYNFNFRIEGYRGLDSNLFKSYVTIIF